MAEDRSVLIAMSGGVDSSVAALLLREQGRRCCGATMRLFDNRDIGREGQRTCCSLRDVEDASDVCLLLGMPFELLELQEVFRREVMERFVRVYEQGGTPNPCIDCNRYLKFGRFYEEAKRLGYANIATGHYARIERDEGTGRLLLKKAADAAKDQSYVLYSLTQEQLSHTLFPLGGLTKQEVRALARAHGLWNAEKAESQDICFVPDGDYVNLMERYRGTAYPEGDFIDENKTVLGTHRGAVRYTLGQRRGLGLAMGEPVYVTGKDMAANTVTVGPEQALFSAELLAGDLNWIGIETLAEPLRVTAKTRYRAREASATAYPAGEDRMRLVFDEPQRAITPGQAVVVYDGEIVLGGGTILHAGKGEEINGMLC